MNATSNTLEFNFLYNNLWGISLSSSSNNNIIKNNTLINHSSFAITISDSVENVIILNKLDGFQRLNGFPYSIYDHQEDRNIYCLDNISNEYINGATGPTSPCVQNITNTNWSDWQNISCLFGDIMNQSRINTSYDINQCINSSTGSLEYENKTFEEYRQLNDSCDYCTPNLTNTTWGVWT